MYMRKDLESDKRATKETDRDQANGTRRTGFSCRIVDGDRAGKKYCGFTFLPGGQPKDCRRKCIGWQWVNVSSFSPNRIRHTTGMDGQLYRHSERRT